MRIAKWFIGGHHSSLLVTGVLRHVASGLGTASVGNLHETDQLNCCWHSSTQMFLVSDLSQICASYFWSLFYVCVFRSEAFSLVKEGVSLFM
jgi:hypothetical protein